METKRFPIGYPMSHFGVLSFKGSGHLNPLIALSRELMSRGHKVTFFQKPELEDRIRKHGLDFSSIGISNSCSSADHNYDNTRKASSNITTLRHGVRRIVDEMEMFLREAPAALRHAKVDSIIMDEIALSGSTLAEMLRLPYFVVSTSVPHNFGWSAPRRIAPRRSWFARLQDAFLQVSLLRMRGPVRRGLDTIRQQAGLGPFRKMKHTFPHLAHITSLPQCLDFPRSHLPLNFHYTGPFIDNAARMPVPFPWDRLDGRTLVYASLGTTLKSDLGTFRLISEACDGLDLQLVISLGGRRDPEILGDLPGNPLVVREAPQLELLERAEIVITHAGPNTVFETLMRGKPMIAIPKAFDQPAIAARLEWLGVAEVLPLTNLSARQIRTSLINVLHNPSYRDAARELQAKMQSARGLERAADVIEDSLKNLVNNSTL
jgi:MGT family glycosyltransferase